MIQNLNITNEAVWTRLIAFAIAIVTGTVLYRIFFAMYVPGSTNVALLAFSCAFGSAVLIDRTIVRARDLRNANDNGIPVTRAAAYVLLLFFCIFVFVLDRGAEILVMKSHRAEKIVSDRKELETRARQAPAILARASRVNWLHAQLANAAKSDSANIAEAKTRYRERIAELSRAQASTRRELAAARQRNDESEIALLGDRLTSIGNEKFQSQAVLAGVNTSRTWKFKAELAREDSLMTADLNAELKRIADDSQVISSAGFAQNPVGFILQVAPSSILWAIVVGLLVNAGMCETRDARIRRLNRSRESSSNSANGFPKAIQPADLQKMASMIAFSSGQSLNPSNESGSSQDDDLPFRRGDLDAAARWLWWRILSRKFQTQYPGEKAGDLAFALRRACGNDPARKLSRNKSRLHRQLVSAKRFMAVSSAEEIAQKLKDFDYFERAAGAGETNGATALQTL